MGHGKETPRQKMIGMMYLVLTALLALNVSAEVLNAFQIIDHSLMKSADNTVEKNKGIYTEFEKAMKENPGKTKPWKDKADQVKIQSDALIKLLDSLKTRIVTVADGPTGNFKNVQKKDDNNVPGQIMVMEDGGKNGKFLVSRINAHRDALLKLVSDTSKYREVVKSVKMTLSTDDIVSANDGAKVPWITANFEHLPLAGVMALMSKMQVDIRNVETEMTGYLLGQIEAGMFKFNKIEAIVSSSSSSVMRGEKYEAQVFIAASDSTQDPEILVGGAKLPIKQGKGIYSGSTGDVGKKQWGGVIKLKNPRSGEIMEFPFKSEYEVTQPSLVVSAEKMNVFYIGVENPVKISYSGVPDERINASITAGSITKGAKGSYIVRVKQAGKVTINVSGATGDGTRSLGNAEFRVKTIPPPVVKLGGEQGKSGGAISKAELELGWVWAGMENFDFDLKVTVNKFRVSTTVKGFVKDESNTGNRLNSAQKVLIKSCSVGNKVYFENIDVQMPDGTTRGPFTMGFVING